MTEQPSPEQAVPQFVTLSFRDSWGIGQLVAHEQGWWVDVMRTGLKFEDAADLRDTWNQRGEEKRP